MTAASPVGHPGYGAILNPLCQPPEGRPGLSQTASSSRTARRPPWGRLLSVGTVAIFVAATLAAVVLKAANGTLSRDPIGSASLLVAFGAFAGTGAVITWRRPGNPIGWMFTAVGVLTAIGALSEEHIAVASAGPSGDGAARLATWFQAWYWGPVLGLTLVFTPLLYPTGRLPSAAWRPVAWLAATSLLVFTGLSMVQDKLVVEGAVVDNPLGVTGMTNPEEGTAGLVLGILILCSVVGAFASVVFRFRRSGGDERLQLKWFTFAAALIPLNLLVDELIPDRFGETDFLFGVAAGSLPIAAGIAILKHHLYGIDLVINRALVYGTLTGGVAAVYVGVVTAFDALLRRSGLGVSLVATALVAVMFQPARERLQGEVDRLLYGERRDPYRVLSRLGKRLETVPAIDRVLPELAGTVAEALRLPYVAIMLSTAGHSAIVAAFGEPGAPTLELPLVYQGERVGDLIVATRAPGERFSARDLKLLEDLARQAGAAARAVRLHTELQLARQRLVGAVEDERRRLRRDLHDGLGPALAGIGLQIQAVRNLLERDVKGADRTLEKLGEGIEDAVSEIRRLVYGLRPPALDQLGLAGALQEQAERYGSAGGLTVGVEAVGQLDALPAAVEVAAYRITVEALTNAARHSGADGCKVRIEHGDGFLLVEVTDDGVGLPADLRTGVGISSIGERAAELGGTWGVESLPARGTRVWARLPSAPQL